MAPCRSIPAQRKTLTQHDSLQSSSAPGKSGFMHRLANRIRHVRLSVRELATNFARSECKFTTVCCQASWLLRLLRWLLRLVIKHNTATAPSVRLESRGAESSTWDFELQPPAGCEAEEGGTLHNSPFQ